MRMCVKKVIVGAGQYFELVKGFTTKKRTNWDQPHNCYRFPVELV